MDFFTILVLIILGYYFFRKYSFEYIKSLFPLLLIPILHIVFSDIIFKICDDFIDSSIKIDNLHKISTYTPYLGDIGRIMEFANEYGMISDIDRSYNTITYIDTVTNAVPILYICIFIIIILSIIELYSILNWTHYTKRRFIILYMCISSLFILCSIYIDNSFNKLRILLSDIASDINSEPTHFFFFTTLFVTILLYFFYQNYLKRLAFKSSNRAAMFSYIIGKFVTHTNLNNIFRKKRVSLDIKKVNDDDSNLQSEGQRGVNKKFKFDKKIILMGNKWRFYVIIIICAILIIGMIVFFCFDKNVRLSNENATINNEYNTTDPKISEEKPQIQVDNITNRFEVIKKQQGNYQVDIDWPVSLNKVSNIEKVHQAIISNAFGNEDYTQFNNNIEDCIMHYFKINEEDTIPSCEEKSGMISIKYEQQFGNIHLFRIYKYANLGGGTGISIISDDIYLYYDINLEREVTPNDIFTDYSKTLYIINKHISLDEYTSKASEIPYNFIFTSYGIIFIFPKYAIGYGYQGNVKIEVPYNELESLISDDYVQCVNLMKKFYQSDEKIYCKGDMAGFPIAMEINVDSNNNIVGKYINIKYNVEFSLEGSYLNEDQTYNITATNNNNKCFFKLKRSSKNTLTGVGISGDTKLHVNLTITD